jgi:hypothetical protein
LTFDMVQTESGGWTWGPFWDEHWKTIDDYNALVRDWNKYLPVINGRTQPVGRPLAASEAQVAQVRKLRKAGRSLRRIAEEMSLGLNTVRTIVGKANGSDRTSRREQERIDLRRQQPRLEAAEAHRRRPNRRSASSRSRGGIFVPIPPCGAGA